MLEAPGRPLPRPMSLCQASAGELSFLLEAVGPGTRALAAVEPGEEIHVFGPLGNGYRLEIEKPLLVGGGIGVAPFPYLSEQLGSPPAILGFRSDWHAEAATLVPNAEVVVEPTLVTEPLTVLLTDCYKVLACGPEPMLEAVRELAPDAQLASEAPMACGYGACYGCSVEVDGVLQRLCVAGPVLEAGTSASWGAASGAGPEGTVLRSTGPESTVPSAASGGRGAGLRPAGAGVGQEGEA
jgi:dihydroorotate dehydrogenase electron transfer subunit